MKKQKPPLPDMKVGDWKGEVVGSCTVNFGQHVQPGPPVQSVEFTYLVMPAILMMQEPKFDWPGIIMIMAPTPVQSATPEAGRLFRSGHYPSLMLTLDVTRPQLSDMLRLLERKRLKDFRFTIDDLTDGSWPVQSWGLTTTLD